MAPNDQRTGRSSKPAIARLAIAIGVCAVIAIGCVQDTPAMFIVQNQRPDNSCQPSRASSGDIQGAGFYDISVGNHYYMYPLVENLLRSSGGYEGNRITMSEALILYDGLPEGAGITRDEVPISGTLNPNGSAALTLEVFDELLSDRFREELTTRNDSRTVKVRIQLFGTTTAGRDVESNQFVYTINVCQGCLLEFPLEAQVEPGPNCQADFSSSDFSSPCNPGQDDKIDCRLCRQILTGRGESAADIANYCEPG
ncbi:MAG: hypothetical protein KC561_00865 [Myxococcales bacterium]|nr:hypothetical protein [Myxococcales bacterium]